MSDQPTIETPKSDSGPESVKPDAAAAPVKPVQPAPPARPVVRRRAPEIVGSVSKDSVAKEPAAETLALAVASAEASRKPAAPAPVATAPDSPAPPAAPPKPAAALPTPALASLQPRKMAIAASVAALTLGLGAGFGAHLVGRPDTAAEAAPPAWAADLAAGLKDAKSDMLRLAADVRGMKAAVEAGAPKSLVAPVIDRLERTERGTQEVGQRLARVVEQLDRLEAAGRSEPARLTPLTERLDRIEKQVGGATATLAALVTTAKAEAARIEPARIEPARIEPAKAEPTRAEPAKEPQQTASLPEKKALDPRSQPLEGFVVRDVYDGLALIEQANKRLVEAGPGGVLPGGARIEAIERRGKAWVVVTSKGVIGMERWW